MLQTQRAVRYPVETTIRYRPVGTEAWHAGRTVNISQTGVLFTSDPRGAPMDGDVEIVLELSALGAMVADIVCTARIVRRSVDHDYALVGAAIERYRFAPLSPKR